MDVLPAEVRDLNKLVYNFPVDPSVVNTRSLKSYNFSSSSYNPGSTAQININSGGDAVWGPTSYIRLEVDLTSTVAESVSFGGPKWATAYNLFKNVRLSHRSGEVLEDIRDVDKLIATRLEWELNNSQLDNAKDIMGSGTTAAGANTGAICLPLKWLLGVFNNKEQYLPPGFLAGAKLEIDLNDKNRALNSASGTADYNITKIEVVLDSAEIQDGILASLQKEQMDVSKSGLQFVYSTWFGSKKNTTGPIAVSFDVQRAASQTEMAFFASQEAVRDTDQTKNSVRFNTEFTEGWQWRLGSQYLPKQQSVKGIQSRESYKLSLIAWGASADMTDETKEASAHQTFSHFSGNAADSDIIRPVYAVSLERSAAGLQMSGPPTNNSQLLNFSYESADPAFPASNLYIFLKYVRVVNIMGENVVVDQ